MKPHLISATIFWKTGIISTLLLFILTLQLHGQNSIPFTARACLPIGGDFTPQVLDLSPQDVTTVNNFYLSNFPGVVLIDNASNRYNCFGYTASLYQGGEPFFIQESEASKLMTDASLIEVPSWTYPGFVTYNNTSHIGVTTENPDYIISKWVDGNQGSSSIFRWGPLLYHHKENVPNSFRVNGATNLRYFRPYLDLNGSSSVCQAGSWYTVTPMQGQSAPSGTTFSWTTTPNMTVLQQFGNQAFIV